MSIDRSQCTAKRHGDTSAYSYFRCRCVDAREAQRLYVKRRKFGHPEVRRVKSVGVSRKIKALAAIGYSSKEVAEYTGISRKVVQFFSMQRSEYVLKRNADLIDEAYRAWCMTPGPNKRAIQEARHRGWLPPLAWDDIDNDPEPAGKEDQGIGIDEVAVRRVVEGRATGYTLTTLEKQAAAELLLAKGWTKTAVEDHVKSRKVVRVALSVAAA
jgi:hypothetical protein